MEAPTTVTSFEMPNFSVTRRCVEFTMSRMLNLGNCMRGCDLLVEGEVVRPLEMASVQMMKYFEAIQRLARPDQVVDAVVVAAERGDHQHGIRLLLVQLAVRDIGDREVLDRLTALEPEVAQRVQLVGGIVGAMGKGGAAASVSASAASVWRMGVSGGVWVGFFGRV
jgi:hypothetical protein